MVKFVTNKLRLKFFKKFLAMEIQEIKQRLSIITVLQHNNLKSDRTN